MCFYLDGLFPRCQQKLKYRLTNKFQSVFEGVPKLGNPTFLEKIYTELYITEGESVEVNTEHEVRQIEMASKRQITERETPIKCTDIFKPLPGQDKPIRTVLTKGVAGIGKTVSVQKFILDWAEEIANENIHFIFPLPFRELNLIKDKKYTLLDIINHFFSETKDFAFFNQDIYNIAFIFDGLDEVMDNVHKGVFLVFNQVQLPKRKRKYEVNILIGIFFSPVQNEFLHRDCFSNASNSLCQHSSDGFVLSR